MHLAGKSLMFINVLVWVEKVVWGMLTELSHGYFWKDVWDGGREGE